MLKLLAFAFGQVQQHCCALFKQARAYQKRNLYLWNKLQCLFLEYRILDWRTFYLAMSRRLNKPELEDMLPAGPEQNTKHSKNILSRSSNRSLKKIRQPPEWHSFASSKSSPCRITKNERRACASKG